MSLEGQECEGSNFDAGGGPAHGADAVAQCQCCTVPVVPPSAVINVNGALGLVLSGSDGLTAVVSLAVPGDRITRAGLIRAPEGCLAWARPRRVALQAGDDAFCRLA
jgi:hypothetical protein